MGNGNNHNTDQARGAAGMAQSADYKLGDYPFPRGWFVVADSAQVARQPFNVHYFGQGMVLYRGASGKIVMLDAYCPHMGTHLGRNETSATVISERFLECDSIRCPFHAWRFGPDGKCNDIPWLPATPRNCRGISRA
jgi:3-ketosteroid 9alpha-monooxygenase subunit A